MVIFFRRSSDLEEGPDAEIPVVGILPRFGVEVPAPFQAQRPHGGVPADPGPYGFLEIGGIDGVVFPVDIAGIEKQDPLDSGFLDNRENKFRIELDHFVAPVFRAGYRVDDTDGIVFKAPDGIDAAQIKLLIIGYLPVFDDIAPLAVDKKGGAPEKREIPTRTGQVPGEFAGAPQRAPRHIPRRRCSTTPWWY